MLLIKNDFLLARMNVHAKKAPFSTNRGSSLTEKDISRFFYVARASRHCGIMA
jgi:hypothetical protein